MVSSVKLSSSAYIVSATDHRLAVGMNTAMNPSAESPSANAIGMPEKSRTSVMTPYSIPICAVAHHSVHCAFLRLQLRLDVRDGLRRLSTICTSCCSESVVMPIAMNR